LHGLWSLLPKAIGQDAVRRGGPVYRPTFFGIIEPLEDGQRPGSKVHFDGLETAFRHPLGYRIAFAFSLAGQMVSLLARERFRRAAGHLYMLAIIKRRRGIGCCWRRPTAGPIRTRFLSVSPPAASCLRRPSKEDFGSPCDVVMSSCPRGGEGHPGGFWQSEVKRYSEFEIRIRRRFFGGRTVSILCEPDVPRSFASRVPMSSTNGIWPPRQTRADG